MGNRYRLDDGCSVLPHVDTPGVCNRCGMALTGRRTQWCSSDCELELRRHHDWNLARHEALKRDGHRCVRCGGTGERRMWTSFHPCDGRHHVPRNGGGYGWGCWNHLENLESLCHSCHVAETNRQATERRGASLTQTSLLDLLEGA